MFTGLVERIEIVPFRLFYPTYGTFLLHAERLPLSTI